MTDLLIPSVDEAVLTSLRKQAAANGNSVEVEARRVLERGVATRVYMKTEVDAWLSDLDAFRASMPSMPANYSSVEAIEEGRRLRSEEITARHDQQPPRK